MPYTPLSLSGSAQNLNNPSTTFATIAASILSTQQSVGTPAAATQLAIPVDLVNRVCAFGVTGSQASLDAVSLAEWSIALAAINRAAS